MEIDQGELLHSTYQERMAHGGQQHFRTASGFEYWAFQQMPRTVFPVQRVNAIHDSIVAGRGGNALSNDPNLPTTESFFPDGGINVFDDFFDFDLGGDSNVDYGSWGGDETLFEPGDVGVSDEGDYGDFEGDPSGGVAYDENGDPVGDYFDDAGDDTTQEFDSEGQPVGRPTGSRGGSGGSAGTKPSKPSGATPPAKPRTTTGRPLPVGDRAYYPVATDRQGTAIYRTAERGVASPSAADRTRQSQASARSSPPNAALSNLASQPYVIAGAVVLAAVLLLRK